MFAARPRRRALPARLFLVAGLHLMALGCGLTDYEKHMDDEQTFLKEFDEENKTLGGALEMPMKETVVGKIKTPAEALKVKFFLRPPRWIATKVKEGESFASGKVTLYRFPGPAGYNLLFTDAELDKHPLTRGDIKDGIPHADFRAQVRGALVQFVQREYRLAMNSWIGDDKLTKPPPYPVRNLHGRSGSLEFEKQEFTDALPGAKEDPRQRTFEVYFRLDGASQAAIIYEMPVPITKDQTARKTVELSLRTLVLGQDASAKIQEQLMRANRPQSRGPMKIINSNDLK